MYNIMFNIVTMVLILPGLFTTESKGMTIFFTVGVTINVLMIFLSLSGKLIQ